MWWLLLACRDDAWFGDGPAIRHLRVRDAEGPLAARVSFVTSAPAVGAVRFGVDGDFTAQVADDGGATEHEIVVIGLHADEEYTFEVRAEGGGGESWAPAGSFRTPPVLDGLTAALLASDPERTQPGWTLIDLFVETDPVNRAAMVDEEGRLVWLWEGEEASGPGALDVSLTPGGEILVGGSVAADTRPIRLDLAGDVTAEGARQPAFDEDGYQHHHREELADGTVVGLEKDVRDGVRGDRIVATRPGGEVAWTWSTWDGFPFVPGLVEQTHLNWVHVTDDALYVSDYASNLVTRIDRASGAPVWQLGWDGSFALTGGGAFFEQQHDPEIGADGRWYVYDNGDPYDPSSRVVAYELDEAARTATEVWSFDGGTDWRWFTGWWGGVDRLENGNVLVSAGNVQVRRALEVTPAQEVVWAIEWPAGVGFYRAERVDPARWGWSPLP